jgi:hypothetical protein
LPFNGEGTKVALLLGVLLENFGGITLCGFCWLHRINVSNKTNIAPHKQNYTAFFAFAPCLQAFYSSNGVNKSRYVWFVAGKGTRGSVVP